LYYVPFINELFGWYDNALNWIIVHTGKYILHLPYEITVRPNGSGDTTWNYVQIFVNTLVSLSGTVIWSIVDRRRKNYLRLCYWFNVIVRYYLASTLISYGSYKIFKTQFPLPDVYRLNETYGQSSPMGLAWAFLGYSKGYNYFMGAAEVLGGLLLLFRRTSTFGALFSMTVTLNIMAINYCFDVPVKIFSTMLFLMACYIAAPDLFRLGQFFVGQKESRLKSKAMVFNTRWKSISLKITKAVIILFFLYSCTTQAVSSMKQYGDDATKPKFYGYYSVNAFMKNDRALLPLMTDSIRWHNLMIGQYTWSTIRMMNDSVHAYTYNVDTVRSELTLNPRSDNQTQFILSYTILNPDQIELRGRDQHDSLYYIKITRNKLTDFPLLKRGFHWINEYQLNR
jgi:uncharacterized membrane protein YphA (DoxX/SURF4 family)